MKKALAIVATIAAAMLTTVGATAPGSGAEEARRTTVFKTTVTPSTGVDPGTALTATGPAAEKSTKYYCVLSVVSEKKDLTASNTMTLKQVTSTKKGKVTCKQTFQPFTADDENGTERHCPTTKKDRRAGFRCGVALADAATIGGTSASVAYFTATK